MKKNIDLLHQLRQDVFVYGELTQLERFRMNYVLNAAQNLLTTPPLGKSILATDDSYDLLTKMFDISTFHRYKVAGDYPNTRHITEMLRLKDHIIELATAK